MSFFDKKPRRSTWHGDSTSGQKSGSWFEREEPRAYLIPIAMAVQQKPSRFTATTFQLGGHQPKDMRQLIQRQENHSINSFYERPIPSGSHVPKTQVQTVSIQKSLAHWEALNIMNSCADFVIFKAQLAARSMKLNPIKILGRAGSVTGVVGLGFSGIEAWNNPTWNNRAQFAMGAGIIGIGALGAIGVLTAPAWGTAAIVGTVVLLVWESGEALYEITQQGR